MNGMAPHDVEVFEAQINALDNETAQRVTRLVFECSASLDLALLAVQEANRYVHTEDITPRQKKVAGVLAALCAR
jgi:hypothetical protein